MRTALVLLTATTWLVSLPLRTALAYAPPKLAVLGGEKEGWNDLLVARLSKTETVSLVERQRLGVLLDERVIQGLLGSRADRGRLGSIAGADLLVLLGGSDDEIRLVVCDTRLGVTLQDLSLPAKAKRRDGIVAAMAEQTLRVVRQVEGGVKHVVAVPDFVSRDLTFEHSFLQSDYAEVLRAAYRQTPGMAIVAVDKAKSIAAEREVAGGEQQDRPVPVFVEGEYRTARNGDSAATVQITLRARNATKILVERKLPAVPLDQAGRHLLAVFADDLAGRLQAAGPAINAEDQYGLLTTRADAFSSLGEFRRSAALREAALLLRPDADEQRVRLVREYTRRNSQPVEYGAWPKGARQDEKDPFWMALVAQTLSDWKRSLQHCEYLIRKRRLCREEATDLAYNAIHSITGVRGVYSKPLSECEAVKKDFLRHAFARIAFLEPANKAKRFDLTGALDVYHFLFECALMRCDGNYYCADDLDLIADLLLTRLPDSMWPSHKFNFFLRDVGARVDHETDYKYCHFTERQYQVFLGRLIASDRPLVRVYGRYGEFCWRRYGKQEKSPELLAEARAIVTAAAEVGFNQRECDYYMTQLRDEVAWLSRELEPKVPGVAQATPRTLPAPPTSRVSLEPIELTFANTPHEGQKLSQEMRWSAPGGSSGIVGYRPLGDGLDALWAHGAVLFMRRPGQVVQVLADAHLKIHDVITDGRYVWVATAYEWGLLVLDRDGKELIRIGKEQGLPPCDHYGMVAHPLGPGRVLAAGSFGNERRAWIAIVEFDGSKPKVEVIHEATKTWDYKRRDNYRNLDPAMGFLPDAMFEHVVPGPKPRRIILVLRDCPKYNPLLVDPETKKVWIYPVTDWYRQCFPRLDPPGEAFLSIDGLLWIAGSERDFRSYRLNDQTGLFQVVRDRPNWHSGNARSGSLARDGDWLYYAGNTWRRIHLRTGEEDLLVADPRALPSFGSGSGWHIAYSAHYGLVAFAAGTLYRVRMEKR